MSELNPTDASNKEASTATDATAEQQSPGLGAPSGRPALEAWEKLLVTWDDDEAHRRFIALCAALGDLAFAGGQYRQVIELHDQREAAAKRHVDAVIAAAAVQLAQHQPAPVNYTRPLTIIAFVISAVLIAFALRMVFVGM